MTLLTIVSWFQPPRRRIEIVQGEADTPRRYLVIVPGSTTEPVKPAQIQVD